MKNQKIKFKDKNNNYSVIIGKNALNLLPGQIKLLCPKAKNVALIMDKNIPNKFKKNFQKKLKSFNILSYIQSLY